MKHFSRNIASWQRRGARHIGAALAGFLFLAGSGTAGAANRQHIPAGDPDYRALYMDWRQGDQPEYQDVAIPAGSPVDSVNLTSTFGVRTDPFRGSASAAVSPSPGRHLGSPRSRRRTSEQAVSSARF